jgi:hypothetical protein
MISVRTSEPRAVISNQRSIPLWGVGLVCVGVGVVVLATSPAEVPRARALSNPGLAWRTRLLIEVLP